MADDGERERESSDATEYIKINNEWQLLRSTSYLQALYSSIPPPLPSK